METPMSDNHASPAAGAWPPLPEGWTLPFKCVPGSYLHDAKGEGFDTFNAQLAACIAYALNAVYGNAPSSPPPGRDAGKEAWALIERMAERSGGYVSVKDIMDDYADARRLVAAKPSPPAPAPADAAGLIEECLDYVLQDDCGDPVTLAEACWCTDTGTGCGDGILRCLPCRLASFLEQPPHLGGQLARSRPAQGEGE
jgi:hypothetical protein